MGRQVRTNRRHVESHLKDSIALEKVTVLGVDWSPASDVVSFIPSISFAQNKRGVHQFPDLMIDHIPSGLPLKMTHMMV